MTKAVDLGGMGFPALPFSFGVSIKSGRGELTLFISLSCFCISSIFLMGDWVASLTVWVEVDSVSIFS